MFTPDPIAPVTGEIEIYYDNTTSIQKLRIFDGLNWIEFKDEWYHINITRTMDKYWITKDGEKIPIQKLDDGHLINAVHYLEKKAESKYQDIQDACKWIISKADVQSIKNIIKDIIAKADKDIHPSILFPIYNDLLEEVHKRGLEERLIATLLGKEPTPFGADSMILNANPPAGYGTSFKLPAHGFSGVATYPYKKDPYEETEEDKKRKIIEFQKMINDMQAEKEWKAKYIEGKLIEHAKKNEDKNQITY